jgi:hypothetical protein
MTFGDLVRMLSDAQQDEKITHDIEVNDDFDEWDQTFTTEWE